MKKVIIALSIMSASTVVMADAKNFAGFNAALGINAVSTTHDVNYSTSQTGVDTNLGDPATLNSSSITPLGSKQSIVPSISLGYNFALDQKFLIGLEANYDLSKGPKHASTDNETVSVYTDSYSGNTTLRQKNHWSLAVKPGYALTKDVMVYAKLAYHNAKLDINSTSSNNDDLSVSFKQKGMGFGAGTEINLNKNLFLRAEIEQITYKSKSASRETPAPDLQQGNDYVMLNGTDTISAKTKSTVGTISIGYRF